jgi:phosphonate transport system permease protein
MKESFNTLNPDVLEAHLLRYRAFSSRRKKTTVLASIVFCALIFASGWFAEIDLQKFIENIWRFPDYFIRMKPSLHLVSFSHDVGEWFWGIKKWLVYIWDTIMMAYAGTVTGALIAFFTSFLASRNLSPSPILCFLTRRVLEFLRTVPDIVFALIFVVSFGLGFFPGVLAMALHTAGALGKLFAEIVEEVEMSPVEGLRSTGASWIAQMRFGVVPNVLPNFLSYALLRFEVNVRGATVMGFVGAGGIGELLLEYIRKFYYQDVGAVLILIIIVVFIIDLVSEKIRQKFMGSRATV